MTGAHSTSSARRRAAAATKSPRGALLATTHEPNLTPNRVKAGFEQTPRAGPRDRGDSPMKIKRSSSSAIPSAIPAVHFGGCISRGGSRRGARPTILSGARSRTLRAIPSARRSVVRSRLPGDAPAAGCRADRRGSLEALDLARTRGARTEIGIGDPPIARYVLANGRVGLRERGRQRDERKAIRQHARQPAYQRGWNNDAAARRARSPASIRNHASPPSLRTNTHTD
jgi:hypothetical protein